MAKWLVWGTLLLFALLFGVGLWKIKSSYLLFVPESERTLTITESDRLDNWISYTPPSGSFTISLPTLPQSAQESLLDPKTGIEKIYEMYVSEADGEIFMITTIRNAQANASAIGEEFMERVANDMIRADPENTLITFEKTEFRGAPAIDFSYSSPTKRFHAMAVLKEEMLYLLTQIYLKEGEFNPRTYLFFINSFQFKKGVK